METKFLREHFAETFRSVFGDRVRVQPVIRFGRMEYTLDLAVNSNL